MLRYQRHRFVSKLIEYEDLTPTVRRFRFSVPETFQYGAGMFMSVSFSDETGKQIGKSYSLASLPSESGFIEFCIKKVQDGQGTTYLFNMQPGQTIKMMGPMGRFYIPDEHLKNSLCFISTGTGISPFYGMIRDLLINRNMREPIYLIAGYRKENEIIYDSSWRTYAGQYSHFQYCPVVSRPSDENYAGKRGYVQRYIESLLPGNYRGLFYLCGLNPMIEETRKVLGKMEISEDRIFVEQFD